MEVGDPAQRRRQQSAIAGTRFNSVLRFAGAQDGRDISPRRIGKPIARHRSPRAGGCKAVEGGVEVRVGDFRELTAIERGDPGLDLRPQRF